MAEQKPWPKGFVITDVAGLDLKKETLTLRGKVGKRTRVHTVKLVEKT